jgi:hypothetical protein
LVQAKVLRELLDDGCLRMFAPDMIGTNVIFFGSVFLISTFFEEELRNYKGLID